MTKILGYEINGYSPRDRRQFTYYYNAVEVGEVIAWAEKRGITDRLVDITITPLVSSIALAPMDCQDERGGN